jgi:NADH-quinone oxidoreductase subunit M
MGLLFGLAGLASIGVPGFANFVGEIMVFFGAFKQEAALSHWGRFQIADAFIIWGMVLSAVYFLRAYRAIFFGTFSQQWKNLSDISLASKFAVILLILALLIVGLYPQPFIQMIAPSLICP